jgi:hypothetical protein
MKLGWSAFFLFFYFYRCGLSVIAEIVISRITPLGDTPAYHSGQIQMNLTDSNAITESFGGIIRSFVGFNPILIDIGYQTLAFIGIYKLMMSVDSTVRKPLALLLVMPSFNLWSSIASKESIIVFSMCIVCTFVVQSYYNRGRISILLIVSLYILYVFKPHYLISIIFLFGAVVVTPHVKQRAFLALLAGVVSLVPLYLFRERIDALTEVITEHFIGFGSSTRVEFWLEPYDVFWRAWYGMFQGFFGPTLSEASSGILHLTSFIESSVIIIVLGYYFFRALPSLPVYNIVVGLFTLFWILFPNYPFGILNPGSAIRYRTGYEILVFIAIIFLMSRDLYVNWDNRVPHGRNGKALQ